MDREKDDARFKEELLERFGDEPGTILEVLRDAALRFWDEECPEDDPDSLWWKVFKGLSETIDSVTYRTYEEMCADAHSEFRTNLNRKYEERRLRSEERDRRWDLEDLHDAEFAEARAEADPGDSAPN
jgi:hypothetical protein